MSGLNSLAVVSARATRWPVREVKYLKPLVLDAVARGFNVMSVAADRGYVSKENHRLLREVGAEAFITFMKNNRKSKHGVDPEWDEDLERFRGMSKVDLALYEERIKIEAVNWMVKSRSGGQLEGTARRRS